MNEILRTTPSLLSAAPRVVLIYADTGGGHRATAQAVAAGLHRITDGNAQIELVNATPYMPYPYNVAERAYPTAIAHARLGYAAFWHLTNNTPYAKLTHASMEIGGRRTIPRFFAEHPADVYVSCHPLVNQMLPSTARRLNSRTPFLAVVSDMVTIHSLFWSQDITHVMVATEAARALAIRRGMPAEHISVTGQPVLPDFAARAERGRAMRRELGLDPNAFTVVLMGGGDGMGRLTQTARAIAASGLPLQLVALCGRNERARVELSELGIHAVGFTDKVAEYMGAADVLASKAGPGAICEAFVAGLPIALYDAVPGQESGNVDLVVESGAGAWCPEPRQVVAQLQLWLHDREAHARAAQASRAQARPNAAMDAARIILNFSERRHASERMQIGGDFVSTYRHLEPGGSASAHHV
jgi:1,2-diacylglycerol 3-beta-galactosyltransferase